jgi:hypothetical protein
VVCVCVLCVCVWGGGGLMQLGLMRDVVAALLQPGGEVRRYTQRFEVMLSGLPEQAEEAPPWCRFQNTTAPNCEAARTGLASDDLQQRPGVC